MKKKNSVAATTVSCLLTMPTVGIIYIWSVFQPVALAYYGCDVRIITMVPSVMVCGYAIGNVVGGMLQDAKGPRITALLCGALYLVGGLAPSLITNEHAPVLLYLTYGLAVGTGTGFAYAAAFNCLLKWYLGRRGFAVGLGLSAMGLGSTVLSPVANFLLNTVSLLGTLRVVGIGLCAIVWLCAVNLQNPPEEMLQKSGSVAVAPVQRQYTLRQAAECYEFWTMCTLKFLALGGYQVMSPIIVTLGITRGLTENMAILCVSMAGFCSAFIRLVGPMVADKVGALKMLILVQVGNMVSLLGMSVTQGPLYVANVLLVTLFYGWAQGMVSVLLVEAFGTAHSGAILGVQPIFNSLGSVVFPLISGSIYVHTGSYFGAFIMVAAAVVPVLLMLSRYEVMRDRRLARDAELVKTAEE